MSDLQEALKNLPDKPGVYLMKDDKGEVIYVGKAVVLKNRVRQYFHSTHDSPKVAAMVSHINNFEYIVTDNEIEALILECNLIKKYRPRYNILLKDDKHYPYIKVTMNEEYPRILKTRRIERDGAKYFGPYPNVGVVNDTINLIRKIFPIKTCNKVLPKNIGKERPCLNYFIKQCVAPCQGNVDKDKYRSIMKDICMFLGGRQEEIINKLEEEMKNCSDNLEFEKAAEIRNKIISIKQIAETQKVLSTNMQDQDVIAAVFDSTDACVQIFFVRGGKLLGREHFLFEQTDELNRGELIVTFLKQFYSETAVIPKEVIIQGKHLDHESIKELSIIEKWLTEKRGSKVEIRVPKRGEKLKMVEMVEENAQIALTHYKNELLQSKEGLDKLADLSGLSEQPVRIEAYDISNTGSSEVVGSMVVFVKGKPLNSEYRRFKIKTVTAPDDYGSIQEVIARRFRRAVQERQSKLNAHEAASKAKFSKMPDLILVDGGLGHVNAVKKILKDFAPDIPVLGMVKDSKHRTRALVRPDREIDLYEHMPVLRLVTAIQNEAHRFALEYNRKLRDKRYRGSILDKIEGIGPKRKKSLIKHFGSIKNIKSAGIDDLMAVEGISEKVAQKVYEFFH